MQHADATAAMPSASVSPPVLGERELKFEVPAAQQARVTSWMRLALTPHAQYPRSLICSVYFDTHRQKHLEEKRMGDFAKTSYRIRWYCQPNGQPLPRPAWLEMKHKRGGVRFKTRQPLPLLGSELALLPLPDPHWQKLARTFFQEGDVRAVATLEPTLEVRYQRIRFTHSLHQATFCLDTQIHCPRVHPRAGFRRATARLNEAVFEQKSTSDYALPLLRTLPRLDVRRGAFSKYERLALQLLADPDSTP